MPAPRNILVIRPEKLGDLVVATPVFRALKEASPYSRITLLTDDVNATLVKENPYVDNIIPVSWNMRRRGPREGWVSLFWKLRSYRFDEAIVLYNGCEQLNWICSLLGIRQVVQIGGTASAVILRHRMVLRKWHVSPEHFSILYLRVAELLGSRLQPSPPEIFLNKEECIELKRSLPVFHDLAPLVIHPFAISANAQMETTAFVRLGEQIAFKTRRPIVICGTETELDTLPNINSERIVYGFGRSLSLRETAIALHLSAGVVGGSSGIIHLAAAVGTATVGIYCPAHFHPIVWGPLGPKAATLAVPVSECRKMGATVHRCGTSAICRFREFVSPSELAHKVTTQWQEFGVSLE